MEWIILQQRPTIETLGVYRVKAETLDEALSEVESIHSEGTNEIIMPLKNAKELEAKLAEVLQYSRLNFNKVEADPKITECVRCGAKLDLVKHLMKFDRCDKCERIELLGGWDTTKSDSRVEVSTDGNI